MTIEFKYAIGALVYLRSSSEVWRRAQSAGHENRFRLSEREPPPMMILSRHVEECHGGVQLSYGVRVFRDNALSVGEQRLFEFELIDSLE